MPKAYYNDNDPKVAQWLRQLVAAGELPEGDVDERSIKEIQPANRTAIYTNTEMPALRLWLLSGWKLLHKLSAPRVLLGQV